jgi:hypothetical protein
VQNKQDTHFKTRKEILGEFLGGCPHKPPYLSLYILAAENFSPLQEVKHGERPSSTVSEGNNKYECLGNRSKITLLAPAALNLG